jgi:argininosuccinate lyase
LKEHLFPAFAELSNCLQMVHLMLSNIEVKEQIVEEEKYRFIFSVEEVNKLVLSGMPFRDAYKKVGESIESNTFSYSTQIAHTHEGSIGNLCTAQIRELMQQTIAEFQFSKPATAIKALLS